MDTNWFVDLFLFCYEMDFMVSLSNNKQANTIAPFNTKSRYLVDILNINNTYFDNMVCQIYHAELQLNKVNTADTEASFLLPLRGRRDIVLSSSLHLSIHSIRLATLLACQAPYVNTYWSVNAFLA